MYIQSKITAQVEINIIPPVSLSSTRISISNNLHGIFGPSPITVRETSNSCSTVNVTRPLSIYEKKKKRQNEITITYPHTKRK